MSKHDFSRRHFEACDEDFGSKPGYSFRLKIQHRDDLHAHDFLKLIHLRNLGTRLFDAEFAKIDPQLVSGLVRLREGFRAYYGADSKLNLLKIQPGDRFHFSQIPGIPTEFNRTVAARQKTMGANEPESRKPLLDVLSKMARLCRRSVPQEAKEDFGDAQALSNGSIERLADHLLKANRHLQEFEIELGNQLTCDSVAEALAAHGCLVARDPFKPLLVVTCPEDLWRGAA